MFKEIFGSLPFFMLVTCVIMPINGFLVSISPWALLLIFIQVPYLIGFALDKNEKGES